MKSVGGVVSRIFRKLVFGPLGRIFLQAGFGFLHGPLRELNEVVGIHVPLGTPLSVGGVQEPLLDRLRRSDPGGLIESLAPYSGHKIPGAQYLTRFEISPKI